jgi:pyrroline-5-carboxylate reductase
MGTAFVAGLLAAKAVTASQIHITDVRPDNLRSLKKRFKVGVGEDNRTAVHSADVVVLCVKPQQMGAVLDEIKESISSRTLVISIAAGITSAYIENCLRETPVIRVMPNTPALLRAGALVYALGRRAKPVHEKLAVGILSSVGQVWRAEENQMDAVTALSGSGPAYVFLLAECLSDAGKTLGLPGPLAESLARQTIYGAGRMLAETSDPASTLRERVTSPGGTTAAALKVLDDKNLRQIFKDALSAARRRSQELSGS